MKKGIIKLINVTLVVAVIVLIYLAYESIMTPIRFNQAYKQRSLVVIEKLKKIRDAEIVYLSIYDKYTGSFDTLINFIKKDSLKIIKSVGVVPDSIYLTSKTTKEAELRALKLGIISRDTIKISIKDTLFANYNVDTLPFIPYTSLTQKFQINAGSLKTLSKATRPVFEVKVHNNTFCEGLDPQELINLNDRQRKLDRFPGYVLGSMNEVTTTGNWD